MESNNDCPHIDYELLGRSTPSQANDRASSARTTQNVQGDSNQVIGQMLSGTAIGSVFGNVTLQQELPQFLSKHQLPPDIADFTGRTREQDSVLAVLRQANSRNLVAISGMAGTGKSALAIRVAHGLSAEFDEVQLYVNLRGAEGHQAVDPATVLMNWLRALGLDDTSISPDLEGRVAAYRSLLQGKRAIVVLDNAQNEGQIRPLLPGRATCAVLITSRQKLVSLQGASFLELPILPENEALALLETLIGATRIKAELEPANAVISLCGRLPLAIRMAAGSLNKPSQQRKLLVDYVQQLQDEKRRLNQLRLDHLEEDLDVRTSFNLSYRELGDQLADLFCWLGLLDAPDFGLAVAAVLIEADEAIAQQGIEALIDAQLLEIVSEKRYRLHDLIRLFAREQLETIKPTEAQIKAKQRVIQYFLKWARFMSNCLHPNSRRKLAETRVEDNPALLLAQVEQGLEQEALIWFEQERINLRVSVTWANFIEDSVAIGLAMNLWQFYEIRSHWFDWEVTHLIALSAALRLKDLKSEGDILNNLGWAYKNQRKFQKAIGCYERSLEICSKLNDLHGKGQTLNNLGIVYDLQNQEQEAIECYKKSLDIFTELRDRFEESNVLHNLAVVYSSQKRRKEAIDLYQHSLEIARQLRDHYGEGLTLIGLGNVYMSQGKWKKAIDCYQQSLQIKRTIGDVHGEGRSLNNLGLVYQSQGKWNEAIDCYQQSLQIYRTIGDVHDEGIMLMSLGLLYQKRGHFIRALEYWQDAIEKLNSDSPEYRQLYAILHPSWQMILSAIGMLVLAAIALTFIVSNLLAGRSLVALIILLVTVTAWFMLKAIQHRR